MRSNSRSACAASLISGWRDLESRRRCVWRTECSLAELWALTSALNAHEFKQLTGLRRSAILGETYALSSNTPGALGPFLSPRSSRFGSAISSQGNGSRERHSDEPIPYCSALRCLNATCSDQLTTSHNVGTECGQAGPCALPFRMGFQYRAAAFVL